MLISKLPQSIKIRAREKQLSEQFTSLEMLVNYANSIALIKENCFLQPGSQIEHCHADTSTVQSPNMIQKNISVVDKSLPKCTHCNRVGHSICKQ